MSNYLFRIAVAGDISEGMSQLQTQMSTRVAQLQGELTKDYSLCFLAPEGGLNKLWECIRQDNAVRLDTVPTPVEHGADGSWIQGSDLRTLVQMSDLADLVLAFWNEDPDGAEAPVWEVLHRCMEKGVPCLWISKKDGKAYWAETGLFEPFESGRLTERMRSIHPQPEWDAPIRKLSWGSRLILRGNKQYQKMLKQGNAAGAQKAAYQDAMMEEEPVLAEEQGEKVRSQLLEAYHRYDSRAVQLSELYRGSIYWRSILPMAAAILLSIGFYAKALFEAVSDLLHQGGTAPAVVYLITGVAFLLHGLMILFSHLLARNQVIQSWHTHFIYNRLVAELLRFYIHVMPYGITLPLHQLLSKSGFHPEGDQPTYGTIWHILHNPDGELPTYREERTAEYLSNLEGYLGSQLEYHQRNTARIQNLRDRLRKLETVLLSAGIATVILRGLAQFLIFIINNSNSTSLPGYWSSIANMIAMIVPAVASYYSGKLTLFAFENNISESRIMQERLEKALELVQSMKGRQVNYSMVRNLTERIGVLMMEDAASWNHEMAKRRIQGL